MNHTGAHQRLTGELQTFIVHCEVVLSQLNQSRSAEIMELNADASNESKYGSSIACFSLPQLGERSPSWLNI